MTKRILIVSGLLLSVVWLTSNAQSQHGEHTPEMTHGETTDNAMPTEGGQSTFAAIIEIVAILEANSETNWSEVNIDALHSHLRDMDSLMLSTTATTGEIGSNTIEFNVEGSGAALGAIHRMTTAHGSFVQQSRGWDIDTDLTDKGATIRITANNDLSTERLRALGFYGFMSLDSHHQAHHLLIATGQGH